MIENMRKIFLLGGVVVVIGVLAGCSNIDLPFVEQPANELQNEEVMNVARQYMRDNPDVVPIHYDVRIDTVNNGWARVEVTPPGDVETEPQVLYLEQQNVGQQPWEVILGPQTSFTEQELDDAGVPADLRQ